MNWGGGSETGEAIESHSSSEGSPPSNWRCVAEAAHVYIHRSHDDQQCYTKMKQKKCVAEALRVFRDCHPQPSPPTFPSASGSEPSGKEREKKNLGFQPANEITDSDESVHAGLRPPQDEPR